MTPCFKRGLATRDANRYAATDSNRDLSRFQWSNCCSVLLKDQTYWCLWSIIWDGTTPVTKAQTFSRQQSIKTGARGDPPTTVLRTEAVLSFAGCANGRPLPVQHGLGSYCDLERVSHRSPVEPNHHGQRVEERWVCYALRRKMGSWYAWMGVHSTLQRIRQLYGYYDAVEDYYSHFIEVAPIINSTVDDQDTAPMFFKGLDFRNNTAPLTNEKGHYSTHLFTKVIEDIITNHSIANGPFFIYTAYQSVHAPLEAPGPQEYIDEHNYIFHDYRRTFCGMLRAADEGIANITNQLQEKDLLDNTIIIFTMEDRHIKEAVIGPWGGTRVPYLKTVFVVQHLYGALSYPNWIMITINYM